GQHLVGRDALVGELAEAGVDAVDGGARGHQVFQAAAGALDALAGGRGEGEAFDLAAQDALGVVEGQAVAAEFEGGRGSSVKAHAGIIAAGQPTDREVRMSTGDPKILPAETVVHRIGGGAIENLRLKPAEKALSPPGISALSGSSAEGAAEQ